MSVKVEALDFVVIDSQPLPVCRSKRASRCTFPEATFGYGTQGSIYGSVPDNSGSSYARSGKRASREAETRLSERSFPPNRLGKILPAITHDADRPTTMRFDRDGLEELEAELEAELKALNDVLDAIFIM
ncbi:hypothetical protein Q0M94_23145 (plasmid) [Deinococcus radiomollis]|uniref:hypothetical protein n=1 Tax=Deinococcus radiomollis TaxID=468916 RepID=UPI0038917D2B